MSVISETRAYDTMRTAGTLFSGAVRIADLMESHPESSQTRYESGAVEMAGQLRDATWRTWGASQRLTTATAPLFRGAVCHAGTLLPVRNASDYYRAMNR